MRKEFPILVARVSEIAILCMRFAIKIIYRRTLYFIACWKEFSFSRKEFPIIGASVSEIEILLKIFRCNAFLPQEFSLLFNLVSRTSILLERITIKMIILIRILVLKRRICYLGNLECATWESANIDLICFANKTLYLNIKLLSITWRLCHSFISYAILQLILKPSFLFTNRKWNSDLLGAWRHRMWRLTRNHYMA